MLKGKTRDEWGVAMRRRGLLVIVCALAFGMLVDAGLAGRARTVEMKAVLNAKRQVPRQVVKAPRASASFTASLRRYNNGRGALTWSLRYRNLTSPVTRAEVIVPAKGKLGEVRVLLCQHCKVRSRGLVNPILAYSITALLHRVSYVEIFTKKNPEGEIRGHITRSG